MDLQHTEKQPSCSFVSRPLASVNRDECLPDSQGLHSRKLELLLLETKSWRFLSYKPKPGKHLVLSGNLQYPRCCRKCSVKSSASGSLRKKVTAGSNKSCAYMTAPTNHWMCQRKQHLDSPACFRKSKRRKHSSTVLGGPEKASPHHSRSHDVLTMCV